MKRFLIFLFIFLILFSLLMFFKNDIAVFFVESTNKPVELDGSNPLFPTVD